VHIAAVQHRAHAAGLSNCLKSTQLSVLLGALKETSSLHTLNLEGNPMDVDSARALCSVLHSHSALENLSVDFSLGGVHTHGEVEPLLFEPSTLPELVDALTQHRALRTLSLKASAKDAKLMDLLRAKSTVTQLVLCFGVQLKNDAIRAIVAALQSNSSLLEFQLPDQTVLLPDELTIKGMLQRNKKAAARADPPTNSDGGSPAPVKSAVSLVDYVRSLCDMQSQLVQWQSAMLSPFSAMAPLSAEHQRRQAVLSALRVIQSNESARGYHEHVRLLLTCAHVGAASLRSGNVEGSGSGTATAGVFAVEQLPKLIAKGLSKTEESIPLLGAGASVLTALIKGADARALNIKMQRVVLMARTPGQLTALVDTLARRLTLLQWATVSSPEVLAALVEGSGFRGWVVKKLDESKAHVQYALKGEEYLTDPQKFALADVERFLKAVAEDELISFDCSPQVVGDEARAEEITLRAVRVLLPGRGSYDEQLPADAAAVPSLLPNS